MSAAVKHPQTGRLHEPARTLREYWDVELMLAEGRSQYHILKTMADPDWRSRVTTITAYTLCPRTMQTTPKRHTFCGDESCQQIVSFDTCLNCGQSLPAVLPTLSEVEEYYIRKEMAARAQAIAQNWKLAL